MKTARDFLVSHLKKMAERTEDNTNKTILTLQARVLELEIENEKLKKGEKVSWEG